MIYYLCIVISLSVGFGEGWVVEYQIFQRTSVTNFEKLTSKGKNCYIQDPKGKLTFTNFRCGKQSSSVCSRMRRDPYLTQLLLFSDEKVGLCFVLAENSDY